LVVVTNVVATDAGRVAEVAGAGNISIDPDFVDLVDFVPQASGLDGAVQADLHYDYDGDQRERYTMGAQELAD
jgi:hypothetical protein